MTVTADDIRAAIERVEKEAPPLSDKQAHAVAVLLAAGKTSRRRAST